MDSIVAVLLGAIAALLIAILVELGRIRLSLSRLPDARRDVADPQEGRQTVTVNVGAMAVPDSSPVKVAESSIVPAPAAESTKEVSEPEPAPEPEPPPPPPKPSIFSSGPKPGSGQLGAIKCSHCGAENSSFRTECFLCGKGL